METQEIPVEGHKPLQIHGVRGAAHKFGWRKALWGFDIWVEGVPLIKTMIAANIVVWILFWLTR